MESSFSGSTEKVLSEESGKERLERLAGESKLRAAEAQQILHDLKETGYVKDHKIAQMYIFGSTAKGTARPESDIDLFFISEDLSDNDHEKIDLRMDMEDEITQYAIDHQLPYKLHVHSENPYEFYENTKRKDAGVLQMVRETGIDLMNLQGK